MALQSLNVTENYNDEDILNEAKLTAAMTSIEEWAAINNLDITQFALDVFGNTYTFNNDGLQTLVDPLVDIIAKKNESTVITKDYEFQDIVTFGDVVTFNSFINGDGQPRARVYRASTNQSILNNTATAIQFNAEDYDTTDIHNLAVNNTRITIPSGGAGLWKFDAQVKFAASAVGNRTIAIYKNGSEVARSDHLNIGANTMSVQVSFEDNAASIDYYEVYVIQTSGGALDVVFGQTATYFAAVKIW